MVILVFSYWFWIWWVNYIGLDSIYSLESTTSFRRRLANVFRNWSDASIGASLNFASLNRRRAAWAEVGRPVFSAFAFNCSVRTFRFNATILSRCVRKYSCRDFTSSASTFYKIFQSVIRNAFCDWNLRREKCAYILFFKV